MATKARKFSRLPAKESQCVGVLGERLGGLPLSLDFLGR